MVTRTKMFIAYLIGRRINEIDNGIYNQICKETRACRIDGKQTLGNFEFGKNPCIRRTPILEDWFK